MRVFTRYTSRKEALLGILAEETGEDSKLTREELTQRLEQAGFHCSRPTFVRDIRELCEGGHPILSEEQSGRPTLYSIEPRFTASEVRLLLDAVQAAGFYTDEMTAELQEKLLSLLPERQRSAIRSSLSISHSRKRTNDYIASNIDVAQRAICEKKQMGFWYFHLGFDREPVNDYASKSITVSPYALLCDKGQYYLLALREVKTGEQEEILRRKYRLDRMKFSYVAQEASLPEAEALLNDAGDYTRGCFNMYSGPRERVKLLVHRSMADTAFDEFGLGMKTERLNENWCRVEEEVQLSPPFFAWVMETEGKIRIEGPEHVAQQYEAWAERDRLRRSELRERGIESVIRKEE